MSFDDDDLEALLRQQPERLDAPEGSWTQITRRAHRRKWAKATLSVAAGLIVLAGAVPAVIAVRHNSDDQTIQEAGTPTTTATLPTSSQKPAPIPAVSTTPTPPVSTSLDGFIPDSVSFVSQTDGYAWGRISGSTTGVVAHTVDGGSTWTRLAAPPVTDSFARDDLAGDGQIRFGSGSVGFIYGAKYFVTSDGGTTWVPYSSPGYIDDLETISGQVYALVRPSKHSPDVSLYSASVTDPTLRQVPGVGVMQSVPGADSVAVNDGGTVGSPPSVAVIAGSSSFYYSPNGTTFYPRQNPCVSNAQLGNPQSALLTTLNLRGVVAACGYNIGGGGEDKRVFITTSAGRSWTQTTNPSAAGTLQTLAAGTGTDFILGTTRGAQITHNGGSTWIADPANGNALSFVGFISLAHVVALTDRSASTGAGGFAWSTNTGKTWTVHNFSGG
jgi:photosystem II stability/assembly factor-like uncharacterized protein